MALFSFNSKSFSSDGGHMAHLHVCPQLLQLVQPDLLLLGQPVARPLHLHQLEHMHRKGLPISAQASQGPGPCTLSLGSLTNLSEFKELQH